MGKIEAPVKEFTLRAVVLGLLLGIVFGVGNAYLGLKIGTTVSASIPAAVMSMALLRFFGKNVTILENNLVQTIASVGEGLAGGVVFTIPALYILGANSSYTSTLRIFILASLGGVLGVLFMIPMRRYIIVQQHSNLPFPEGTACAAILKSAKSATSEAFFAITGIAVGAVYKMCSGIFFLWKEVPEKIFNSFERTVFSMDCTPSLLGVGYIIGPRIASVMMAGGALTWWVLIPLVTMFGGNTVVYPLSVPISSLSAEQIWSEYIRFIGVGAVSIGGIMSLFKLGKMLSTTFKVSLKELFHSADKNVPRGEQDISMRYLILGSIAIMLTLLLFPGSPLQFLTILLLLILGFFFVAVTSITVGLVGSTSNPVSGMTITTLLITCLIFLALGWTDKIYIFSALTMACVANVAICLAGTTSQDLKTGYLVGATPKYQQLGEILGVIFPALFIGGVVYLLNETYHIGSSRLPAPQGVMMSMIAKGVIEQQLPVTLVIIGVILGLIVELLRLPVLPFAIGLYLPLSLSTPIMFGGIISFIHEKIGSKGDAVNSRAVLISSGLIAGDACMGIVVASLALFKIIPSSKMAFLPPWASLVIFALLGLWLFSFARKKPKLVS